MRNRLWSHQQGTPVIDCVLVWLILSVYYSGTSPKYTYLFLCICTEGIMRNLSENLHVECEMPLAL